MGAKNSIRLFELNEQIATQLIREMLGIEEKAIEVMEVKTNTSRLYKDIEVLFFHQKGTSIFASNRQLTEFKYDLSNNCGVVYERKTVEDINPPLIKTLGNVGVLAEKKWI